MRETPMIKISTKFMKIPLLSRSWRQRCSPDLQHLTQRCCVEAKWTCVRKIELSIAAITRQKWRIRKRGFSCWSDCRGRSSLVSSFVSYLVGMIHLLARRWTAYGYTAPSVTWTELHRQSDLTNSRPVIHYLQLDYNPTYARPLINLEIGFD